MHLRPKRYQYGTLAKKTRKRGPDVWEFRYDEPSQDGRRRRFARIIGNIASYPTEKAARRALEPLLHRLNVESRAAGPTTISMLIDRFIHHELVNKRYSTQKSYLSCLKRLGQRWTRRSLSTDGR